MSIDQDPLPYLDISEDDYPRRAAEQFVLDMSEPDFVILRGLCPRCGDSMTFPVLYLEEIFSKAIWRGKSPLSAGSNTTISSR